MSTILDLVKGIQQEISTSAEDDIILGFIDTTGFTEIIVTVDTTSGDTTSLVIVDGVTVEEWREEFYEDTYNQAHRALRQVVFSDNWNVNKYRSDMEEYETLLSADNTATIVIEFTNTDNDYIQVEYPSSRTGVNLLRLIVDATANCFVGLSNDGVVYEYYGSPTNETNNIAKYSDSTSARQNYIILTSGTNKIDLPVNRQMRFGRVYFDSDSTSTVHISELAFLETVYADSLRAGTIDTSFVTVSSPDGNTTFDGNSITVRDENGVVRVVFGRLT